MSDTGKEIVAVERIEPRILMVRGQKVLLDADLAALYGVTTKRLNEQVKRNRDRFPPDFMFQLMDGEKTEVVANCDHLHRLKFSPVLPFAFTEHGAVMVASILNTPRAVEMSVFVVRAFVKLREVFLLHKEFARRLDELERLVGAHGEEIKSLVSAIRRLMAPSEKPRVRIGFQSQSEPKESSEKPKGVARRKNPR